MFEQREIIANDSYVVTIFNYLDSLQKGFIYADDIENFLRQMCFDSLEIKNAKLIPNLIEFYTCDDSEAKITIKGFCNLIFPKYKHRLISPEFLN